MCHDGTPALAHEAVARAPCTAHEDALTSRFFRPPHMSTHRIFTTSLASVYVHYVAKVEKKQRTQAELDTVICWLTGYSEPQLRAHLAQKTDFQTFFGAAPAMHPNRAKITGVVCGVRVEDVADPLMQQIRWLDKLVDELAKGRAMAKVLRA